MTEQEAMIRFDFIRCALLGGTKPEIIPNEDNVELMDIAINALEEVQQYRAIGTVDECRAAVEKQTAKKPKEYEDKFYGCPSCGNVLLQKWEKYNAKLMDKKNGLPYCLSCGQRLDWSDEDE